jgi:hypothetical protein
MDLPNRAQVVVVGGSILAGTLDLVVITPTHY